MSSLDFEEQRSEFQVGIATAFQTKNVESLVDVYQRSTVNESDKKAALDQAFRDYLLKILSDKSKPLETYISLCIEFCRKQIVTPTMPVVLLGDVFDALTIDKCEDMFCYVENGVNIWKEDLFFVACKNNLLRMCNDLLRRLSRSQNTVFCGRILLFLAKVFPFSERSGLNIVSEFNLENVTEFGSDNSTNLKESLENENEEEGVVSDTKNKLIIDYNLYCKFWALQDYFRNPNSCYNKVQWKVFMSHASNVLSAFGSYKLEALQLKSQKRQLSSDESMETIVKEQHYFAKFLTNQKLLELQLSDSNFRRCVLVQFLILFQYLNSPVKFKMEGHELKQDQTEWVKDTTDLVYKLISETPPDGKVFCECVRHILKREEHWNSWKNDGCPEFQKPKPPVTDHPPPEESPRKILKARKSRPLGEIIENYESQGKFFMGGSELTKLWNLSPDNLEACRSKDRDFMPPLETYFAEAIEALDGGNRPPQISDSDWGWRALRLLAHRSPHFFTHSNNPIGRLPDYLDTMVRRVARELQSPSGLASAGGLLDDGGSSNGGGDSSSNHVIAGRKNSDNNGETKEEEDQADTVELKTDDANDIEQMPDSTLGMSYDDSAARSQIHMVTVPQIEMIAKLLINDWRVLAGKLGYAPDEILHLEAENPTDVTRAKKMLLLWSEDEDASVENLVYILEGLKMDQAAEFLKETVSTSDG